MFQKLMNLLGFPMALSSALSCRTNGQNVRANGTELDIGAGSIVGCYQEFDIGYTFTNFFAEVRPAQLVLRPGQIIGQPYFSGGMYKLCRLLEGGREMIRRGAGVCHGH